MESDVSQDIENYWNEYCILQETKLLDDYLDEVEDFGPRSYEDGEQEAEWLQAAGLSHLSAAYAEGRELADTELDPAVSQLPPHQAEAVRRRVRTLNLTVRGRGQQRHHKQHRKPDIRDVFRDLENCSTGTQSRSATPDSLDSDLASSPSPPSFRQQAGPVKDPARRLPSISLQSTAAHNQELFRRAGRNLGDVASDSGDGIRMVGYQRLGTLHLPRPKERFRSGSDPTNTGVPITNHPLLKSDVHSTVTRSHSHLNEDALVQRAAARAVLRRSSSQTNLSLDGHSSHSHTITVNTAPDHCPVGRTWIDYLGETDVVKLQNLVLMEVTALLDSVNIPFHKRKAPKRKAKDGGNVFGVALTSLLERDRELTGGPCLVPLIFQKLFSHLEHFGVQEEGILRLSGSKHKVDGLIRELETEMYSRPEQVDQLLGQATCHDVVDILKRLVRDLPSPLFTFEYIDVFYQTHLLPEEWMQKRALNLLVLMLPVECRNTLRALFKFLGHVIRYEYRNRMSLANVAMIVAPSLFNPSYIRMSAKRSLDAQVNMAVTCCQLTRAMLECGDRLWEVPVPLVGQIRRSNEDERYRKGHKENSKPMKRLLGRKTGARDPIARKIDNEVDFQGGVVRITAPQFRLAAEPVQLADTTKAGDVVLGIVERATKASDLSPTVLKSSRRSRFEIKSRALIELAPNGSFNCFLATGDPEMTLQTHYLYEVGGNIGQRQIEHDAVLLAVYKENPNAQWVLKCHHRTGHNSTAPS